MIRYKATATGLVKMTKAEEAQRDADELAWANGEKARQRAKIQQQISEIETIDRSARELLLKSEYVSDPAYQRLKSSDDNIKLLRDKLNLIK